MEAAAQHCARLAHDAAAHASKAAPPCHETAAAVASTHGQTTGNAAHHPPAHDQAPPSSDHCECIAALNDFTNSSGALASSHVVPYAWLPPEAASFASNQPDPHRRPPRA